MGFRIVSFIPRHADAFRILNEDWINANFKLEACDRAILGNPEEHILKQGGHILVALLDREPVGVCALIKHGEDAFELAKLAVAPEKRGLGIGRGLCKSAIAKATKLGAKTLYLEGNTKMTASIRLYRSLGFVEVTDRGSAYCRCNITMESPLCRPGR